MSSHCLHLYQLAYHHRLVEASKVTREAFVTGAEAGDGKCPGQLADPRENQKAERRQNDLLACNLSTFDMEIAEGGRTWSLTSSQLHSVIL